MPVLGTDGELGKVSEVVADVSVDVFRGIVLEHGLFSGMHGFIPADKVLRVEQNQVHVGLSKAEANDLPAPTSGGQEFEGRAN